MYTSFKGPSVYVNINSPEKQFFFKKDLTLGVFRIEKDLYKDVIQSHHYINKGTQNMK